jgi:hypothetical protein
LRRREVWEVKNKQCGDEVKGRKTAVEAMARLQGRRIAK